ncbi:MAG: hypothetical protein ACSLE5_07120 [Porticoccaceae bacterium]
MSTADLKATLDKLADGASWTISRDEFRAACDEDDKIVYLTIARRMANARKYYVTIEENDFVFEPRTRT